MKDCNSVLRELTYWRSECRAVSAAHYTCSKCSVDGNVKSAICEVGQETAPGVRLLQYRALLLHLVRGLLP